MEAAGGRARIRKRRTHSKLFFLVKTAWAKIESWQRLFNPLALVRQQDRHFHFLIATLVYNRLEVVRGGPEAQHVC